MITLEKIDRELINIADDHILSNNIVGITVQIDSHGIAKHSALLIGVEGDYSLFHYDSYDVLLENPSPTDKWFFCKSLDFINAEEFSLNFLAHCMIIMNEDPPEYGFLFDGSYYTSEGKYFTDSGIRNFTTCVGFCIKVLAGFIQNYDGYFELGDWDEDSMKSIEIQASDYFKTFFKTIQSLHPNITEEEFRKYYKRITPSEYVASAYLSEFPIRKNSIDLIIQNVEVSIKGKRLSA